MTKQIGNSELLETWASEGDTSEPFLSKRRQGWLFQEQPASSLMNAVQNETQQKINHLLKNGVSEWSPNTDYTRGACVKHANTAWKARRDNVESEPAQGNRDWIEIEPLPIIRAPDLISPIDGASDIATAAPLVASEYAPVYSVDDRDYRRFEVDVAGGDFSDPIRTNDVDADTWNVDPVLETSGGYIWRCRDVSVRGDQSPWSDIESFTTGEVFITQPSITAPSNNATGVTEAPTLTSSAFAVTGGSDTHVASYWRVFRAGALVWESGRRTNALVSIAIPEGILVDGETTYTVQVRHEGAALGLSSWSAASTFTTLDMFARVQTPAITSPLADETGVLETPTFTSGAFVAINGSDTHRASFWEVYTAADSLVWSSGRSFTNRTSITLPQAILQDGQTGYKVRVRHEGQSLGLSDWSPTVAFTTATSFGRLFSGAANNIIRSINASGLSQRGTFTNHIGRINGLAYGAGDFLYTASQDGSVRKISSATLSQDAVSLGSDPVLAVCFGTDGFVYTGSGNTVRKLNASNLSQSASFTASGTVRALTFGGDEKLYVGAGPAVQKVTPADMTLDDTYTGNNANVLSLCFGADGFLYSGSANAQIHRITPATMAQSVVFNGTSTSFNWVNVNIRVAVIQSLSQGSFSLTNQNTRAEGEFAKFQSLNDAGLNGMSVFYTEFQITPFGGDTIEINQPKSGTFRKDPSVPEVFKSGNGWGSSGTWNTGDGQTSWFVGAVQERRTTTVSTGAINALAFGTDGFLYVGFEGRTVRKFNAAALTETGNFTGHTSGVNALTFGTDGFLYSGAKDNAIRRIDTSDMTQAGLFSGNTDDVTALASNTTISDLLGFPL